MTVKDAAEASQASSWQVDLGKREVSFYVANSLELDAAFTQFWPLVAIPCAPEARWDKRLEAPAINRCTGLVRERRRRARAVAPFWAPNLAGPADAREWTGRSDLRTLSAQNVGPGELATLAEMLLGALPEGRDWLDTFEPVRGDRDLGVIIAKVPGRLVGALAQVDAQEKAALLARWRDVAALEGYIGESELAHVLTSLPYGARVAVAKQKGLFIEAWGADAALL